MSNLWSGPDGGIMSSLKSSFYYYHLNMWFDKETTLSGAHYDAWGFEGHIVLAVGSHSIKEKVYRKEVYRWTTCVYVPPAGLNESGSWEDVSDMGELLETSYGSRNYNCAQNALLTLFERGFNDLVSSFGFLIITSQFVRFGKAVVPETRTSIESLAGKVVMGLANGHVFFEK